MTGNAKALSGMRRDMPSLLLSHSARRRQRMAAAVGNGFLLAVTSLSTLAVLFIFYFIARDALPFFRLQGFREFFTSARWYPSAAQPEFGALAIFVGTGLVTLGAVLVAVPLGVAAAICLSDVLPFAVRQVVKPVIEILAAIPSVAYGFFALVVLAPLLQQNGGPILGVTVWIIGAPVAALAIVVLADLTTDKLPDRARSRARWLTSGLLGAGAFAALTFAGKALTGLHISSGTNALNVSVILGIMALPTVVSVSEDALQAVGRELREGSYALGATRAETLLRTVLPAAGSGILAAVILGVMRAIGETMVVWMASGNATQIPSPWYNLLEPVRTLTATIAGDMGEADQVTGSARYHVLFAMALCLLLFSFLCNLSSEWIIRRARKKVGG
jgi:phosphate transport system permease protein